MTGDLGMQPGTAAVRIVVVDRSSGATGSVTVAVGPEDKSDSNVISPDQNNGVRVKEQLFH